MAASWEPNHSLGTEVSRHRLCINKIFVT
uniref:Uncharacterized protein n=1 Tax=Arundo donax TaxID=35708 RepID=A0A0A8ZS02_ARUDO